MLIKHRKVLAGPPPDDPEPNIVHPSDWHDGHDMTLDATARLVGRISASAGPVEELTAAQAKTLLAIQLADVDDLVDQLDALTSSIFNLSSSLAPIATSGSASDLSTGTIPAARMPAHTGDVTSAAGSVALAIANNAVTYAKMQDVSATQRAIGRNSAGAGDPQEVTASQILDWVSSTNGVLLTRTAGAWAALGNVKGDAGDLVFAESSGSAPSAGNVKLFGSASGGRQMLAQQSPAGARMLVQPYLGQQHPFSWVTGLNNAILQTGMINPLVTGTATGRSPATTNSFTLTRRIGYVSAAGAGSVGGLRCSSAFLTRQQGFHIVLRFGIGDAAIVTTGRMYAGIRDDTGAPTDANPSGFVNSIAIGTDANDTTLQLYASGAVAQARTALVVTSGPNVGGSFPANTTSVDAYELALYSAPGGATVTYQVTRLNTGDVSVGTISAAASLPASTALLTPMLWRSNGATASAVAVDLLSMYGDTDM